MLPDFENYAWFEPLGITTRFEEWPKYLDLASLAGLGSEDSPPGIFPTILTMARLHVNKDSVAFSGVLQAKPMTGGTGPPIFSIDQVDLFAEYAFGSHDGSGIAIELGVRALIQPPPDSDIDPAEIKAEFLYPRSSKPWSLKGSVDNLLPAHFYQFFRSDHSFLRKMMFFIEFIYQTVNMIFAWFAIGNFFLVFKILTDSLGSSNLLGTVGTVLGVVFEWFYAISLAACFVLSMGNRPSGSGKLYTAMVVFWCVIMA